MTDKMAAERELEEQLLEEQLMEAGSKLLRLPSSLDELLPLLDQVENFLSRVEQSPAKSMQAALSPLTNALVTDELFRHSNVDVKVAVASCISEITRITAPDAPYDDDKMKEVFQLIVSSFEDLSDESSRSYNKRAMILETVAKVRSCVVMLDLECDGLIAEMFQLFLGTIRDYHPENIFSSMATIMSLVLEESEDISCEILTPLLASVRKDNQEVLPVAVQLAEKVFENCAAKLKPYVNQAIKSLGKSLDDYGEVVATVCKGPSSAEHINENASTQQLDKLAKVFTDEAETTQADKANLLASPSAEASKVAKDVNEVCPVDVDHNVNRSSKSIMMNGGDNKKGSGTKGQSSGNAKEHDVDDEPSADKVAFNPEVDDSEAQKEEDADSERGRKPSCSINVSESSDTSHVDGEKEVEKLPDLQESHEKDLPVEASKSLEKETVTNLSSPKASENEAANTVSPSLSGNLHEESHPKKAGRAKKKEISIQEETPPSNLVSKKTSEGTNDSEAKPHRRSGKHARADATKDDKLSADVDTSKSLGGGRSDSETKHMKQLGKEVDEISNTVDGYSLKRNSKKRGRGKAASENDPQSPARSAKVEDSPEKVLEVSTKRKRTAGKDKATESLNYGDNLVGSKVKVWWPQDREFYEGVIESFDPVKKKHKVSYNDGDEEILNLRKEKWEFVDDGSLSSEEQAAETESPDGMSGMQKRKKAKRNPESSVKTGKTEGSPKRFSVIVTHRGDTSCSKLKGAATKSGNKTEGDPKLKDRTPKLGGKTVDDSIGKSKSHSQRTSDKHVDDSPKISVKFKDVDGTTSKVKSRQDASKSGSKSKQDTPKTGIKSRNKTSQAGGDGSASGRGKLKYSSSKTKETGDVKDSKEKSADVVKTPEGLKGKSSNTSKVQEIETGSMKKRRRAG